MNKYRIMSFRAPLQTLRDLATDSPSAATSCTSVQMARGKTTPLLVNVFKSSVTVHPHATNFIGSSRRHDCPENCIKIWAHRHYVSFQRVCFICHLPIRTHSASSSRRRRIHRPVARLVAPAALAPRNRGRHAGRSGACAVRGRRQHGKRDFWVVG
jgi:hypothetical protein